jgi:hypothetical protein
MKLLLENKKGKQFSVEVKDLKEAVERYKEHFKDWSSSDYNYPDTGRVTYDNGDTVYISYNGRVWDREYWISSPGATYNKDAKEVFV